MISKNSLLVGGALVLALPLSTLLSGCGGGSSSSSSLRPTYNSALTLAPGQIAQLSLNGQNDLALGKLVVPTKNAQFAKDKSARGLSVEVPAGSYPLFGTFTAPNLFNVSGKFPAIGNFTIIGQTPESGGSGAYTLTVNGETATGNFQTSSSTATPPTM